jgi:inosine/xanthosine triphosphate pyrophosphatase family protein
MTRHLRENHDTEAERVLYFATTSTVKFAQYRLIFSDYDVSVRHGSVIARLVEPQLRESEHPEEEHLVGHPLRLVAPYVMRIHQLPYVIEDTMLLIRAFSKGDNLHSLGLPGADTKSWWRNLGAEGVLRFMQTSQDREAAFVCQLGAYLGGSRYCYARAELRGNIATAVRIGDHIQDQFPRTNPYFFHSIFIPAETDKTIAEMNPDEFARCDYRRDCARHFLSRLEAAGWPRSPQIELPFQGA